MKYAEQKIHEASRLVEVLDREIAALPAALPGLPQDHPCVRELRAARERLSWEREKALVHLLELINLDETPINEMGQGVMAKAEKLTPKEVSARRQKAKETSAYFRKAFAHLRPTAKKA